MSAIHHDDDDDDDVILVHPTRSRNQSMSDI